MSATNLVQSICKGPTPFLIPLKKSFMCTKFNVFAPNTCSNHPDPFQIVPRTSANKAPFDALAENATPPVFTHPPNISEHQSARIFITALQCTQSFTTKFQTCKCFEWPWPDIILMGIFAQFCEVTAKVWLIHLAKQLSCLLPSDPHVNASKRRVRSALKLLIMRQEEGLEACTSVTT